MDWYAIGSNKKGMSLPESSKRGQMSVKLVTKTVKADQERFQVPTQMASSF